MGEHYFGNTFFDNSSVWIFSFKRVRDIGQISQVGQIGRIMMI